MKRYASLVAIVLAVAILHRAGRGELGAPPIGSAAALGDWVEDRGAVVGAFALLRLLAIVAGWYLVGISVLGAVARAGGRPRLAGRIDALTLPVLRRVAGRAGIGTVAAISALGTAPAWADSAPSHPDRPPPTMHMLDGETPDTTTSTTTTSTTTASTTTTTSPSSSTTATTVASTSSTTEPTTTTAAPTARHAPTVTVDGAADDAASPSEPSPDLSARDTGPPVTMRRIVASAAATDARPSAAETWTIEPGESFWSVAASHVREHVGREPDDREIERYWRTLMAANPHASPTGDPDLLYSGTVLVLPPIGD